MNNNHFQGTFPPGFVNPEAELKEVWVHENLLSGTVSTLLLNNFKLNFVAACVD
jgi:hypothetical protein